MLFNPYVLLVLGVTYIGTFGVGYYKGSVNSSNASRVTELTTKLAAQKADILKRDMLLAETKRQSDAVQAVNVDAGKRADEAQEFSKALQERVDELQTSVTREKRKCALTAVDVRGLRRITASGYNPHARSLPSHGTSVAH